MKAVNKLIAVPLLTTLAIATGAAWAADTTTPGTAASAGIHGRHDIHHEGRHMRSPFMASLGQLNLSDAQHKSVESLMDGVKQQREANRTADRDSFEALGNPGDKNYASAVQTAKTQAAASIQQRADLETQIYNLLTAEQKTKLPQVLAEAKARHAEQRQEWQQRHREDKKPS
jgi:Spy/CpxP family protein refolding chaperone